jgi:flagellar transcriptional activator FlhD
MRLRGAMRTKDVGIALTPPHRFSRHVAQRFTDSSFFTTRHNSSHRVQQCQSAAKPPTHEDAKEHMMDSEQLLAEIREANLTYLMLAQNLIRKDRAEALFRLGLTEEAADLLGMLSTAQLLKIASSNMLLCRFRVDDDLVWNLLTSHNVKKVENSTTTQLHASILMAGKYADSVPATAH